MKTDPLEQAAQVFVQGFGFARSQAHPYLSERFGRIWVMRDTPRKNPIDYRREEWIAHRVDPVDVDRTARKHTRGRFAICAMLDAGESDAALRAAYKALGYRLQVSEPIFAHALRKLPPVNSPATIERVLTPGVADALAKAAGRRQIRPQYLKPDAPIRAYVAQLDGEIVGWVSSIVCVRGNWCQNLFVVPAYRRRHIATALMATMLTDDRAHGAKRAVLTASQAGAKLYVTLGYERVGSLLLFNPRK